MKSNTMRFKTTSGSPLPDHREAAALALHMFSEVGQYAAFNVQVQCIKTCYIVNEYKATAEYEHHWEAVEL